MKRQVFFKSNRKIFLAVSQRRFPTGLFPSLRDYRCAGRRRVPVAIKKSKIAAAEGSEPPTPSGGIAKLRIELFHCGCGKLLVPGRKVLTIAAYLSATHLERFRITHIARMQNV